MRVVFNASTAVGDKTGVGRYTAELLRCLQAQMQPEELVVYPHNWVRKLRGRWKSSTAPRPPSQSGNRSRSWIPSPRQSVASVLRPIGHGLLRLYDRVALRQNGFDLYHEPNFIPMACKLPTAITFHDLSVVTHPEWHPGYRVAMFEKHLPRALEQSVHFFTVTEFVRREMIERLHIPREKITCTYNGNRPDFVPMDEEQFRPALQRLGMPNNYLLHLGTIEPRKNLLRLMQAYVDLPAELRERCPLVLAGQWGWRFDETADFFFSTARHRGVIQTGFVPDADLPAVYNGARALVFPSLYEGFGIPAIEMMGCGGAVLASTAGALAEVVGKQAALIEPQDVEGWRDAMKRVITDDQWWQGLKKGVVERAGQFTWERTATETLRVYQRLAGVEPRQLPKAA